MWCGTSFLLSDHHTGPVLLRSCWSKCPELWARELALLPVSVCFPSSLHWGLCIYRGLMHHLCRRLTWSPRSCFFPLWSCQVVAWRGWSICLASSGGHGIRAEAAVLPSDSWAALLVLFSRLLGATSVSLDQVFCQDLASLDPVPICGVEWVGLGCLLSAALGAQWGGSHSGRPFCPVWWQASTHTPPKRSLGAPAFLSHWFSKQPTGLVSSAQEPRTGTPSLWFNPLTSQASFSS